MPSFKALLRIISSSAERPADIQTALAAAPPAGTLPLPQFSWVLLGLLRYYERQRWAWPILQQRLSAEIEEAKNIGSEFSMWRRPVEKVVPGEPEWEFMRDDLDLILTHKLTRERIRFDSRCGPGLINTKAFFQNFHEHRAPGPVEERLRQLFPHCKGLCLALGELGRARLLRPIINGEFGLNKSLREFPVTVESFLAPWREPESRVWLTAAIGDWPAAHDAAQSLNRADLMVVTGPRAEGCRQAWLKYLHNRTCSEGVSQHLLRALADAGPGEVGDHLGPALADRVLAKVALEIVYDDPAWCPHVYQLLLHHLEEKRRDKRSARYTARYGVSLHGLLKLGSKPLPSWIRDDREKRYAYYLARHGYRVRDVIDALLAAAMPPWDVIVPLALDSAPELVRTILPQALQSLHMKHQLTAAAVLALLDTPWSRSLLLNALILVSLQGWPALECWAALRESQDPSAGVAANEWYRFAAEAVAMTAPFRMYEMQGGVERVLRNRMDELFELVRQAQAAGAGGE